jgi:hypothetical protein
MKRAGWIVFAGMICMASAVNAQLRFGVKGGVNIATVRFDRDVIEPENITGFLAGPMVEVMIPVLGVGVDAALLYTQKGLGISGRGLKSNYLELPVNLKWKINLPLVKPFLAAGPYAGFRLAGGKRWEIDRLYDDVKGQIENRSFSAGVNFSAGVEVLKIIQVGVNYGWELTDNYQAFDAGNLGEYTGKSHLWSLSAAFFF